MNVTAFRVLPSRQEKCLLSSIFFLWIDWNYFHILMVFIKMCMSSLRPRWLHTPYFSHSSSISALSFSSSFCNWLKDEKWQAHRYSGTRMCTVHLRYKGPCIQCFGYSTPCVQCCGHSTPCVQCCGYSTPCVQCCGYSTPCVQCIMGAVYSCKIKWD